jgi:glutaredoxin
MKAKRILGSYNLKETLNVIEVNLRGKKKRRSNQPIKRNCIINTKTSLQLDDDYQVKMVLKEISGRETFPNIFLNGKSIGGSDNLEELHETGQLQLLLTENQLLLN